MLCSRIFVIKIDNEKILGVMLAIPQQFECIFRRVLILSRDSNHSNYNSNDGLRLRIIKKDIYDKNL